MADRTPARDRFLCRLVRTTFALGLTISLVPAARAADDGQGVGPDKGNVKALKNYTPEEALAEMTVNMTEQAKADKFEPYMGERQLKRQFLEDFSGKGLEAMFLTGPRGAGKTVFVESIAGELEGREIFALNTNSLEAGTQYRGSLEDRVKALLDNFVDNPKRILFIDELHTMMKIDGFGDVLKPYMSAKRIAIIGATTEDEYRDYVEKDQALVDRPNKYTIPEFTLQKAIDVLRLNAPKLERESGFFINDDALERIAKLSFLYYSDRSPSRNSIRLLKKAIRRKTFDVKSDKSPFELLAVEDRVERSENAIERLKVEVERKLKANQNADVSRQLQKIAAEGELLADALADARLINEHFERIKIEKKLEKAVADREEILNSKALAEHVAKANAADHYVPLAQAQKKIEALVRRAQELGPEPDSTMQEITADDVGRMVATDIGITNESANESEVEKLARIERGLEKLGGNKRVKQGLLAAFSERLMQVDKITGTLGTFLFAGARGSGKSFIEKILTEIWFGDPSRVVRISMNGLRGMGGAAAIWGHEKGIVDSEQGGLIDPLRRRPFGMLNLDEVEKGGDAEHGHPALDSFHQGLDIGFQHDARGRKVSFLNTLVMMTGNLTGHWSAVRDWYNNDQLEAEFNLPKGSLDNKSTEEKDDYVLREMMRRAGFSESIVDRITDMFVMDATSPQIAKFILRQALQEQQTEFYDNWGVKLDFGDLSREGTGSMADVIVDHYYDANQSGRYYHRLRKALINRPLSLAMREYLARSNSGRFVPGSVFEFTFEANAAKTASEEAKADPKIEDGNIRIKLTREETIGKEDVYERVEQIVSGNAAKKEPEPYEVKERTLIHDFFPADKGIKMFMKVKDRPDLTLGRSAGEAGQAIDPRGEETPEVKETKEPRERPSVYRRAKAKPAVRQRGKARPKGF